MFEAVQTPCCHTLNSVRYLEPCYDVSMKNGLPLKDARFLLDLHRGDRMLDFDSSLGRGYVRVTYKNEATFGKGLNKCVITSSGQRMIC